MGEHKLLVGWFCPWAQRAWIVANLLHDEQVQVISDYTSVVLDTDSSPCNDPLTSGEKSGDKGDGIARFMLKGHLLGSLSVPALLADGIFISGDSIHICKILWESQREPSSSFIVDAATEDEARVWSDILTTSFYNALMNRPLESPPAEVEVEGHCEEACVEHFEQLLSQLAVFGVALRGPYFRGDQLSLVDVAIWPFVQRIFGLGIFQVYRSGELTTSSLSEVAYPPTRPESHGEVDPDPNGLPSETEGTATCRRPGIWRAMQWYERCLALPAFRQTLPHDCTANGCSASLTGIYKIYAMGIGLKSVNYTAAAAAAAAGGSHDLMMNIEEK